MIPSLDASKPYTWGIIFRLDAFDKSPLKVRFVVARSGSTNHQAVKPQDVTRAMSKALDAEQVEEEEARHRCCGDYIFKKGYGSYINING